MTSDDSESESYIYEWPTIPSMDVFNNDNDNNNNNNNIENDGDKRLFGYTSDDDEVTPDEVIAELRHKILLLKRERDMYKNRAASYAKVINDGHKIRKMAIKTKGVKKEKDVTRVCGIDVGGSGLIKTGRWLTPKSPHNRWF